MDFQTMRENCIQIHQECYELSLVTAKLNMPLLTIPYEELSTNEKTKSWDGMGRYAGELFANESLWNKLPETLVIYPNGIEKLWVRRTAMMELFSASELLV